jgi:hypothetical protein
VGERKVDFRRRKGNISYDLRLKKPWKCPADFDKSFKNGLFNLKINY